MENIKPMLQNELIAAMRAKDDLRRRTIRMVLSSIKLAEVEKRLTLDDSGIVSIIQKEIKNRRESIQDAIRANRTDLVSSNEDEIHVLEGFLPSPLSNDELINLVKSVIAELNAKSLIDMGRVIREVLSRVQGKASGDQVSQVARQLLQ